MMNAIVMAGGFGNRLKPLTDSLPKPMLNICNRPMIDYCVAQLVHHGISDIVFSLGYRAESIIEFAAGYKKITAHYSVEDTPLGTLGGVKAARDKLCDTFVVVSGDGLNNIDLSAMRQRHEDTGAEVTIAVKTVQNPQLYGIAQLGEGGLIKSFVEKPHGITAPSHINCGTYIMSKRVLDLVRQDNCDFAKDLFPLLVEQGRLAYYLYDGYWCDIGDIQSYYRANYDVFASPFYPPVPNVFDNDLMSRMCGAKGRSLVSVSANANSARLTDCIIGHGARVSGGSQLTRCVVLDGVEVDGCFSDCIISREAMLRIDGNRLEQGMIAPLDKTQAAAVSQIQ